MLKTAALALAFLVGGIAASDSALAGGTGIRHFPARIGKFAKSGNGGTMKHFPRKLDKQVSVAGSQSKVVIPRRLPGL